MHACVCVCIRVGVHILYICVCVCFCVCVFGAKHLSVSVFQSVTAQGLIELPSGGAV